MTLRSDSFKKSEPDAILQSNGFQSRKTRNSINLNGCQPVSVDIVERSPSFKSLVQDLDDSSSSIKELSIFLSPRPVSELDEAAVKVQKVYKSYRTRRNLADCAVVVEELWWKALDFAELKCNSVLFFHGDEKHETAVSKWTRARIKASKVGKGLCKDDKAQKLALQHWLEAIDPRHRYGHNLHFYYDIWSESQSHQPFFYWLDIGDGKELNLKSCPRTKLHKQCIKYLGPAERETYEVIVKDGKLIYKQTDIPVETSEDSKWIFVLSTSRNLYVGRKSKGVFQHSSFLAGGATTAAGRLVAHGGILEAIWPYSGHYHPTEENFLEFINFLEEHNVNLINVKKCSIDDDNTSVENPTEFMEVVQNVQDKIMSQKHEPIFGLAKHLSCKWSTGAGPRIGCVRDYPPQLQFRALEQVKLSPRVSSGSCPNYGPIPSPRPSPKLRISPRLSYIGLPSPRTSLAVAN